MRYQNLYILSILLLLIFFSSNTHVETKSINNNTSVFDNNLASNNVSNRVQKEDNYNNKEEISVYVPYKPQFYELDSIEKKDNIVSNVFDKQDPAYSRHVFRGPITGVNINTTQQIDNGNDINLTTKGKFNSSISGSYLYSLAPRFRMGPEIMHTTYDSKSNININDSFSLMLRSEFILYKKNSLEIYAIAGTGLSFNTLNLIYTKLTISTNTPVSDSYVEYIVKPIINGSSVPHKTAYFYCSTYPRFNNLNINVINDPKDNMKGVSEFTGDGFGICIYQNTDNTKSATIKYQEFLTPEKATSIPWFLGIGLDYNLNSIIDKLMNFTFIDNEITSNKEVGVSLGLRYFDNGTSTVKYKLDKVVDQYSIKYKGYFSLNISLFIKL